MNEWQRSVTRIGRCSGCSAEKLHRACTLPWLLMGFVASFFLCGIMGYHWSSYNDVYNFEQGAVAASAGDAVYQSDAEKFKIHFWLLTIAIGASVSALISTTAAICTGFCCKINQSPDQRRIYNRSTYFLLLCVVLVILSQVVQIVTVIAIVLNELSGGVQKEVMGILREGAEINISGLNYIEGKYKCCSVQAVTGGVNEMVTCPQHTNEVPDCTTAILASLFGPVFLLLLFSLAVIQIIPMLYSVVMCCQVDRTGESPADNLRNANELQGHALLQPVNQGNDQVAEQPENYIAITVL